YGRSGQIAVRGGCINPLVGRTANAQNARFDDQGRYLTGDLGHVDAEGFLYVDGRVDDRISRGGEKIAPQIVEAALLRHPAVARTVVFGMPDPILSHRVAALIEPRGVVDAAELRAFAAEKLERTWTPDEIFVVDKIPETRNGKVSRRE